MATSARKLHSFWRSSAGARRIRSNVKTTSRAENGVPSDQSTPERMEKRSRVLFAVHSYPVASQGM